MGRLAGELAAARPGRSYKPQAIEAVLAQLDDEDSEALLAALQDTERTAPTIARALLEVGFLTDLKDPDQAVRSWRSRNGLGRA